MNPVLIFRHIACEGPAYLSEFLGRHHIPFEIIKVDEGEDIPGNVNSLSGLVFMGGPMSVNDPLPWIEKELDLIRMAHQDELPVLGHCLGGQLISKALGGTVMRNPVTEIGWFPLQPVNGKSVPDWAQALPFDTEIFHWHGETFTLPENAVPLFKNRFCKNQGFVLNNTYALQCHVEMNAHDVSEWLAFYKNDIPAIQESVQSPAEMLSNLEQRISRLHDFADRIYTRWLNGFKPGPD